MLGPEAFVNQASENVDEDFGFWGKKCPDLISLFVMFHLALFMVVGYKSLSFSIFCTSLDVWSFF